jgi:periplasmic copper chaperone A
MRKAVVMAAAASGALALAPAAFGHATLSPPVAKAKVLQQFTLSVPTEEEGATTTSVELTVPTGFAIDSFEPSPGWKRSEQATGSGEEKVIQTVTWSGGKVPTDEDAVFRFNASLNSSKTYTLKVRQTYSSGKVVDWTGSESSDTPAPLVDGVSSLGGGGTSTLAIVALIVGAVGVLIGIAGLATRGRPLA